MVCVVVVHYFCVLLFNITVRVSRNVLGGCLLLKQEPVLNLLLALDIGVLANHQQSVIHIKLQQVVLVHPHHTNSFGLNIEY